MCCTGRPLGEYGYVLAVWTAYGVVAQPDGIEAGSLGRLSDLHETLGVVRPERLIAEEDPDLYGSCPSLSTWDPPTIASRSSEYRTQALCVPS